MRYVDDQLQLSACYCDSCLNDIPGLVYNVPFDLSHQGTQVTWTDLQIHVDPFSIGMAPNLLSWNRRGRQMRLICGVGWLENFPGGIRRAFATPTKHMKFAELSGPFWKQLCLVSSQKFGFFFQIKALERGSRDFTRVLSLCKIETTDDFETLARSVRFPARPRSHAVFAFAFHGCSWDGWFAQRQQLIASADGDRLMIGTRVGLVPNLVEMKSARTMRGTTETLCIACWTSEPTKGLFARRVGAAADLPPRPLLHHLAEKWKGMLRARKLPVFGLFWQKRRRQRRKENLSKSKMQRMQSAGKNSKILSRRS